MIRIIALIVLGLAALANSVFAQASQRIDIHGKVLNESEQPMNAVSVYVMTESSKVIVKTGVTDENGQYQISQVPQGRYYIEVAVVGYTLGQSESFDFQGEVTEIPTITMLPESQGIEAVEVTGQRPMIQSTNGKLVLNVENSTLAAGNNALEVLQRAPGVTVDKDENILLMGRSGINVTIDGRQTFMTGEQLATFLKSLDGNQIKSIEVGTTRSAREDAEGATGSINIVLKKNDTEGFNGTFTASAAHGQHARGNTSASLNYKKNSTTLFGSYAYTNNKIQPELGVFRIVGDNPGTAFDQDAEIVNINRSHNYRFGVEHKTSDRNTMLLQFSANNNNNDSENNSITYMNVPNMAVDSTMATANYDDNAFNRYSLNFNNEFLTDTVGGKLTVDADVTNFKIRNNARYNYTMRDADGSLLYDPENERAAMPIDINIYVGKLDYEKPIGENSKIETGVKYSYVKTDNNMQFEHFINDQWQDFEGRSNHFVYTEQVSAAYVDYSREFGKWSVKGGLRGEYTVSDGNSVTLGTNVPRDYFDLFPSINITHTPHENHILSLSYAKKISRPNYRFLNPFEYYIDRFTFQKGNEYLKPQYTHGFTLNYTLMRMFNFTLGSDITLDAMTESMGQDEETKRSWIIRENLGRQTTSYLNMNTPFRIGKRWTMNNNLTLVHMHFKGPIAGAYVDQGTFMAQLNNMSTFKINDSFTAETSLNYTSPFVYNVYKLESRWGLDAGINYNFKDKRSSLKLAATDIFRTNKNNLSTRFDVFHSDIRQYHDSQTIRLTYSLRFGNLKQNGRRNDRNNEERERAGQ